MSIDAELARKITTVLAVTLAWAYVGLRLLHSVIHLTYNRVLHRAAVLGLSNFVVVALLLRLAWQIF